MTLTFVACFNFKDLPKDFTVSCSTFIAILTKFKQLPSRFNKMDIIIIITFINVCTGLYFICQPVSIQHFHHSPESNNPRWPGFQKGMKLFGVFKNAQPSSTGRVSSRRCHTPCRIRYPVYCELIQYLPMAWVGVRKHRDRLVDHSALILASCKLTFHGS